MLYADSASSAFPLEPPARAPIAHDAIHRLYDSSRWGNSGSPRIPGIGGAAANYDAAQWAAVHAAAAKAMMDAGFQHRLQCDGALDHSLPQELLDRSVPPLGSNITAQRKSVPLPHSSLLTPHSSVLLSAQELLASFLAQGAISETPAVDPVIPPDLLARVKKVDPEPFLVTGMIAKVGTRLPVAIRGAKGQPERVEMLFTKEFLADLKAQVPVVQHPEHLDHQRGAFARRPNVSYMLAAALNEDGTELWGKAWIPASQTELINEIKAGLAAKLPPAWSVEGPATLIRAGDDWVAKPGSARLLSIDWVETGRPGVPGAGPAEIVSAQNRESDVPDSSLGIRNSEFPNNASKEEPMNEADRVAVIAALTLKELQDGRPDLVSSIVSAQASSTELEDLKKERDALKTENEGFKQTQITAQLEAKRTELLADVKDEHLRDVASGLLTGQTVVELDANWPKVQERIKPLIKPMPAIDGASDADKKPAKGLTC